MTAIVPPVREDGAGAGEKGADGAPEGATTLTVAQRRWCIGAAVVVMGLASLGTALYQTNASDVDPASADAIAPLETAQSGSPAVPPGAGAGMQGVTALPPGYPGLSDPALGALGQPGVGGLPPLSLMPAPAAGGALASPYAATPPAQSQALSDPPSALGSSALPPGASLPAAGATAPSTAGTSRSGAATAGTPGAAGAARSATPYRQTGTPGVIEVAPGQAPPPGYRRVYPGNPRAQAAPGTSGTSRPSGTYQQRTAPGATQPRYRSSPYGQTSPNGTSTTPQRRTQPQSGTQTTPNGATTQPTSPNLLGGLGG